MKRFFLRLWQFTFVFGKIFGFSLGYLFGVMLLLALLGPAAVEITRVFNHYSGPLIAAVFIGALVLGALTILRMLLNLLTRLFNL